MSNIFAIDNRSVSVWVLNQYFYNSNARLGVASFSREEWAKAARSEELVGLSVFIELIWGDSPQAVGRPGEEKIIC